MTDGLEFVINADGVATLYDDTYDITIHCESKEEQDEVIRRMESYQWIPVTKRLPEENGEYLVTRESNGIYKYVDIVKKTNTSGDIASDIVAWMPLPEPARLEGEK